MNRKDAAGPERVRGRLPRPRQHRALRSVGPAARRRAPRPVRRHELDGDVLPEHARDRARAGADQQVLRRRGDEVLRALPLHRARGQQPRRRGALALERGRRLLLRRARHRPAAHPVEGPLVRRPDPAVRGGDDRTACVRHAAGLRRAHALVPEEPPGPLRQHLHDEPTGRGRAPADVARRARPPPPNPRSHARRGRVPLTARIALALEDPRGAPGLAHARRTRLLGELPAG